MIRKIISGGQTGADQAGLDLALELGIPHGGWIPKGRRTENGPLPDRYRLQETFSEDYAERTEQNVLEADGTLIFSHGQLTGGSRYTLETAQKHHRPCLHVDLSALGEFQAARTVTDWVYHHDIAVLNVAGPRASSDPLIYDAVTRVLRTALGLSLAVAYMPGPQKSEPHLPETVDEAVNRLTSQLTLRDKARIANLGREGLRLLETSLGHYIRDKFALEGDNRHLMESCRQHETAKASNSREPAAVIIEALWKKLRSSHRLRVVK